jgi:hypothetical protein
MSHDHEEMKKKKAIVVMDKHQVSQYSTTCLGKPKQTKKSLDATKVL